MMEMHVGWISRVITKVLSVGGAISPSWPHRSGRMGNNPRVSYPFPLANEMLGEQSEGESIRVEWAELDLQLECR